MSKGVRYLLAGCMAIILLLGSFSGGLVIGWFLPHNTPVSAAITPKTPAAGESSSGGSSNTSMDTLFAPFWEAWKIVHEEFVDQPVDETAMMRGAIRGMMQSLGDQHSSYMDPDEYRQANMPMDGAYEGIGAYVDTTGEYLTITSPMTGSPAEKAGLKSGDTIVKVDGEDMTGIDGNLVLRRILGPAGSKVTLTVVRKDVDAPFDVTITRAKITLKSVEYKMLDNNIAYVQVSSFADTTTSDLKSRFKRLAGQKAQGLDPRLAQRWRRIPENRD